MAKNNRRRNKRTRHHILPSSRWGGDCEENIALIHDKEHKAYHIVFSNMTPNEIIHELVNNYWNGQWGWVAKAIVGLDLDDGMYPQQKVELSKKAKEQILLWKKV